MKLATDTHNVQRMYPNDFADSLTSRSRLLFVQTFMVPTGMNHNDPEDPLTFPLTVTLTFVFLVTCLDIYKIKSSRRRHHQVQHVQSAEYKGLVPTMEGTQQKLGPGMHKNGRRLSMSNHWPCVSYKYL